MRSFLCGTLLLLCTLLALPVQAVELVTLSPETWDAYAPRGKEVDAIYGDLVLRNDQLVAVIARPVAGRNANMTVRNVGGAVIDLASRREPNDQLSAYYPGGKLMKWRELIVEVDGRPADLAKSPLAATAITVRCLAEKSEDGLAAEVRYRLADGDSSLTVESQLTNTSSQPQSAGLRDEVRADSSSFEKVPDAKTQLFWVYDKWFNQAYGLVAGAGQPSGDELAVEQKGTVIKYPIDGNLTVNLMPGATQRWTRRLLAAPNRLVLRQIANDLAGLAAHDQRLTVVDKAGQPIAASDVEVYQGEELYGRGRTDAQGQIACRLPQGEFEARINAPACGTEKLKLTGGQQQVTLPEPGYVVASIRDERGQPIPAKVQFRGTSGTPAPYFFHESGEHAVHNLYYTHNGQFRQALAPGEYEAIVSYGTEHDAVFKAISVRRGEETKLKAVLVHSVQTPGWVSGDFHSHSSPSGDNTSSQLGRVLNLLCEHIEYAPCTEHNRLSSYEPHLDRLGVRALLGTSVGIELTDSPLPLNHHNAFPLVMHEHTQDNGAPLQDADVELKVERLALWDNKSDKLVQQNHPDIGNLFFDRNGDGRPDEGFKKVFPYLDCIEVHPLNTILDDPAKWATARGNNRVFNWLQLLNQGYRIPGVVNTDAHWNHHGSGFLRNYIASPTDDPAKIQTLDIVYAVEQGHVVMTSGPYLEVQLEPGTGPGQRSRPGDTLVATDGKATLGVRVQCPNWFDIDRVQVLLGGRPVPELNFTRDKTPQRFHGGTVKFDQRIPLELKGDTHVIVVAAGEQSTLGPVFGAAEGKSMPIAVSNPIYVDVDGSGFKPNSDTLGAPLPVKAGTRSK